MKCQLHPTISPIGDSCFFSSFKIILNLSQAIKYDDLLWKSVGGIWLISQGGEPGPWEVCSLGPWDDSDHNMGRLRSGEAEGKWVGRHRAHLLRREQICPFQALRGYFCLASLLFCERDIRILEILRNPSCGSLLTGRSIIPRLTEGISSDFRRSF